MKKVGRLSRSEPCVTSSSRLCRRTSGIFEAVITPAPPPPEYFRPNEWDIGAFGTYTSGTGDNPTGTRVRDGFSTTLSGETTFSVGAAAWISLIISLGNMQV